MEIAQSVARWFLAFVIGILTSLWIVMATVNLTIANRDVTKQWLASAGIYDNALTNILHVSSSEDQTSILTPDILRQALAQTFDPTYLRQSVNTVIDATYDWLEGKAPAITFSIPVQDKAEAFRNNLTALLIPKLQALPTCPGRVTPDTNELTCLPAGTDPAGYAAQLTRPSSNNTFLSAPLTQKDFQQGLPQFNGLPNAFSWLRTAFWALPVAIVVLAGLYVLASPDKLLGLSRLGRQLALNAAVTLVAGLFLWFIGGAADLSQAVEGNDPVQMQTITHLVNPLVHTILPDIGRTLALCSGLVVLIGGLLWLGILLWQRRVQKMRPAFPITNQQPTDKVT